MNEHKKLHGEPETVIVNGKICVENGKIQVTRGSGKFLRRESFNDHVYESRNKNLK